MRGEMGNTSTLQHAHWETRSYNGIPLGRVVRKTLADTTYRARYYPAQTLFGHQNREPDQFFDKYPKPTPLNRETVAQQTWRGINRAVHRRWAALGAPERAWWNREARRLGTHRVHGYGWQLHQRRTLRAYRKRGEFLIGSSPIGQDYVLYGRLWTVGLSRVASGDKLGGLLEQGG